MNRDEMEEIKRYFSVVAEGLRGEIRQVSEGVVNLDEKLERFRREVAEEFGEVKSMIRLSYAELDRRIRTLEEVVLSLQSRVERLEGRQG